MELSITPERLGVEIRELTRQAKMMTLYYGVEIGRRLEAAKSLVAHGEWGDWIQQETEFSQSTASRFMRLFEEYGDDQIGLFGATVKSSTLQNLSISNALRLLAVPESEREAFAQEVDAEHISARDLDRAIKERDAARREAEQKQKVLDAAEHDLRAAREDLREMEREKEALENREPEIVYKRDEEAIRTVMQETREETERKFREQISEMEKSLKKAEKEKTDAQTATTAAQEETESLREELEKAREQLEQATERKDEGEAQRLMEEIGQLKRKLALSDKALSEARVYFKALQVAWKDMKNAIGAVENREQAGQLRAAVRALLEAWSREAGCGEG